MAQVASATNAERPASPFLRSFVHAHTVQRMFLWTFKTLFRMRLRNPELAPLPNPCIFASNHASHYDLFLALAAFCEGATNLGMAERWPVPVVWSGLRKIPILGSLINAMPCVWVTPGLGHEANRAAALRQMIGHLRAGRCLVMGCEGRRNDALGLFEQGAAFVSLHTGAPIVPISLRGSQGLYDEIYRPKRFRGNVEVVLHPPLNPAEFKASGGTRAEIVARYTKAIRDAVAADLDYGVNDVSTKQ